VGSAAELGRAFAGVYCSIIEVLRMLPPRQRLQQERLLKGAGQADAVEQVAWYVLFFFIDLLLVVVHPCTLYLMFVDV
jgi:hypothetical protein